MILCQKRKNVIVLKNVLVDVKKDKNALVMNLATVNARMKNVLVKSAIVKKTRQNQKNKIRRINIRFFFCML